MRFSARQPPWPPSSASLIILCTVLAVSNFNCSVSQPRNIEVFYPSSSPPPPPPTPFSPPLSPPTGRPAPPPSNRRAVGIAVGVTAASTLLVAGLLFFLISRCRKKRRVEQEQNKFSNHVVQNRSEAVAVAAAHGGGMGSGDVGNAGSAAYRFGKFEGNLKGLIVDENGLDVVYWRKLEGMSSKNSFKKEVFKKLEADEKRLSLKMSRRKSAKEKEPIQEIPLLRGKSSTSQIPPSPDSEIGQFSPMMDHNPHQSSAGISAFQSVEVERQESITIRSPPHPPSPPPVMSIPKKSTPPPPPPKSPPPPPPKTANKNPPPPPRNGVKPPPAPPPKAANNTGKKTEPSASGSGSAASSSAVKMKPLHWDKVNANVEHSMVWDKIDGGSFQFDGDMMEALFGYVAKNRKSPQRDSRQSNSAAAAAASQVFILDSRKSQNIAIVLKSLSVSRQELINGLTEGRGLSVDTLEKLVRIAPSKEEEELILGYNGDPAKLAFAESFLYQILRPVPTAFDRVSAMLFRMSYDSEVGSLKEMVKLVELGCEELRRRGLFLKLLEAVLKAGNRMNAGTSRGNAQAFNLTALRKLSDVKSTDGKTTLLHFVVEEVVRSEGKRCALNRNRSLSRSDSHRSTDSKEELEKDYMILGLPIVGGLSSEFSNVNKASAIDYDQFSKACGALEARVAELRRIVSRCSAKDGAGEFVRDMGTFVESAEQELRSVKEEQNRVTEVVRKTTEYYQTGALKDREANHFQLFVIIKDFLGMVDQVCIEIARNAQRRKASGATGSEPSSKNAAGLRTVKFPNLPEHFMSEKSMSNSSDDG